MNKGYAWASFLCGLLFWVPLFNFILGPLAIYFGIKSMLLIRKNPQEHGGLALAIIGTFLGALFVITFVYALIVRGPAEIFERTR